MFSVCGPLVVDKVLWAFTVRHIGAGEHDGLVIAVVLASEPLPCVEQPGAGSA